MCENNHDMGPVMTADDSPFSDELDLFDFLDALWKRKYLVAAIVIGVILITSLYCFGIRTDARTGYEIEMFIRYPSGEDVVSPEPNNPEQKIDIGKKVKFLIGNGVLNGVLRNKLAMADVPEINVQILNNNVSLLKLFFQYHDKDKSREIIDTVLRFLKTDSLVQDILSKEKKLLSEEKKNLSLEIDSIRSKSEKMKKIIDSTDGLLMKTKQMDGRLMTDGSTSEYGSGDLAERLGMLSTRLIRSRRVHQELLNRLIRDVQSKQKTLITIQHRLRNIENAFAVEGEMMSIILPESRISNKKIIVPSGIVGLALGMMLAFLLEIRSRRYSDSMR